MMSRRDEPCGRRALRRRVGSRPQRAEARQRRGSRIPSKASAAELQLVPANVSIGVAKTSLFPNLSPNRAFGPQSTNLRDLFKGSAMTSRRRSMP